MSMPKKQQDFEPILTLAGSQRRESATIRIGGPARPKLQLLPGLLQDNELELDLDLEDATPVFSEAAVREILARADAAEHAAAQEAKATRAAQAALPPAAPILLSVQAARGAHIAPMIWVATVLTLVMLMATLYKVSARISEVPAASHTLRT